MILIALLHGLPETVVARIAAQQHPIELSQLILEGKLSSAIVTELAKNSVSLPLIVQKALTKRISTSTPETRDGRTTPPPQMIPSDFIPSGTFREHPAPFSPTREFDQPSLGRRRLFEDESAVIVNLQKRIAELEQALQTQLQTPPVISSEELQRLKTQIEELKIQATRVDSLHAQLLELSAQHQLLKQQKGQTDSENASLKSQIARFEAKEKDILQQLDQAHRNLREKTQRLEKTETKDLEEQIEINSQLRINIQSLNSRIQSLEKFIQSQSVNTEQLKTNLQAAEKEKRTAIERLAAAENSHAEQISKLEASLVQANLANIKDHERLQQELRENQALRIKTTDLEQQIGILKHTEQTLAALQKQHDALQLTTQTYQRLIKADIDHATQMDQARKWLDQSIDDLSLKDIEEYLVRTQQLKSTFTTTAQELTETFTAEADRVKEHQQKDEDLIQALQKRSRDLQEKKDQEYQRLTQELTEKVQAIQSETTKVANTPNAAIQAPGITLDSLKSYLTLSQQEQKDFEEYFNKLPDNLESKQDLQTQAQQSFKERNQAINAKITNRTIQELNAKVDEIKSTTQSVIAEASASFDIGIMTARLKDSKTKQTNFEEYLGTIPQEIANVGTTKQEALQSFIDRNETLETRKTQLIRDDKHRMTEVQTLLESLTQAITDDKKLVLRQKINGTPGTAPGLYKLDFNSTADTPTPAFKATRTTPSSYRGAQFFTLDDLIAVTTGNTSVQVFDFSNNSIRYDTDNKNDAIKLNQVLKNLSQLRELKLDGLKIENRGTGVFGGGIYFYPQLQVILSGLPTTLKSLSLQNLGFSGNDDSTLPLTFSTPGFSVTGKPAQFGQNRKSDTIVTQGKTQRLIDMEWFVSKILIQRKGIEITAAPGTEPGLGLDSLEHFELDVTGYTSEEVAQLQQVVNQMNARRETPVEVVFLKATS